MTVWLSGALALWLMWGSIAPGLARLLAGDRLRVTPQGPYRTIQEALADAKPGGTIEVHGGVYAGPLTVDKPVELIGLDWPVIDGGGVGTVVTLAAAGIRFRGFVVRGSGIEPDRDHAGITLSAPDILVEDNRLEEVLFGVFVAQADRAVVRGNEITSKAELDLARRGDGIRLWYSQDVRVEENHVYATRDVVMWYSRRVLVLNNRIERGRYGVHLMYCDDAQIIGNVLLDNSVGIYTMYSEDVSLRWNDIRRQRGPSGYALGFKDADRVEASHNLLVDNRAGVFLDGTPFTPAGFARFTDNVLAFNDIGISLLPAVRGAEFRNNTFWENVEQVSISGSGAPGVNTWLGNYWSDYAGYDGDGDGRGELAYRSERFFESLTDREPMLRALLYSPAAQGIEFAAASFPIFKPQPKFSDAEPRVLPAELPVTLPTRGGNLALVGLGMLAFGMLSAAMTLFQRERRRQMSLNERDALQLAPGQHEPPTRIILQVIGLTKRYGRTPALQDVSFELNSGEAVALWGENGAGKTTLLKAVLGLVEYQGQINVAGMDAGRRGKDVRRLLGYVPQETAYYDMSVRATMAFYARLKRAPAERIERLLSQLKLEAHVHKPVRALSGGLKQRLALALALLSDPPLLLLDEPTANLDAQARQEYLGFLQQLRRQGKTILFASHRLEEVEVLADRVLILQEGRLMETLAADDLRRRLTPQVELALKVEADSRERALALLLSEGLQARLNGGGGLVVRLDGISKMRALNLLSHHGVAVLDFEVEASSSWS